MATRKAAVLSAVVDPTDAITEATNDNNSSTTAFPGALTADLTMSNITMGMIDGKANYVVEGTNQGDGNSLAFRINAFVGNSSVPIFFVTFDALPTGGTATRTFPWIPEIGANDLRLVVDGNQNVEEADETNNTATAGLPDLTFTKQISVSINEDGTADISFEAINTGSGNSPATVVRMALDNTTTNVDTVQIPSLGPGESIALHSSAVPLDGRHLFEASIDYGTNISETNETNNSISFTYTAGPLADLFVISASIAPEPLYADAKATITFVVSNTGENVSKITIANVYDATTGDLLGTIPLPAVQIDERVTITFEWLLGVILPTEIKIVLDPDDLVAEGNDANNVWIEPV
jgi:subtilase family serine protease